MQSQGVSATIKHYAVNNSEYFRFTSDSVVSERALREIYLPVFEAAVKQAHVGAMMDSYNLINGEHATQNYHLNVEIAKEQWGFDGVMMSDWTATHDGIAAANAGLDLEMPFGWYMNEETLLPAVKDGKVKESVIDDKIRRILRDGYRFGWMEHDPLDENIPRYNQDGRLAALQGAREGLVLLKNEHDLLPLDPAKVKTIAVIGPDAFPGSPTAGGSGMVPTFYTVSALKGISDRLGVNANVLWARGVPKLSILSMRSGFSLSGEKFAPGLTVETFDNPQFTGKPLTTHVEMTANSGQNFAGQPGHGGDDSNAHQRPDEGVYGRRRRAAALHALDGLLLCARRGRLSGVCGEPGQVPADGRREDSDRPCGDTEVGGGADGDGAHAGAAQGGAGGAERAAFGEGSAEDRDCAGRARWWTRRRSSWRRRRTR